MESRGEIYDFWTIQGEVAGYKTDKDILRGTNYGLEKVKGVAKSM